MYLINVSQVLLLVQLCNIIDASHRLLSDSNDFHQKIRYNHVNLIGVSDPTGAIPVGHVFISRMGHRNLERVFLTRVRIHFMFILSAKTRFLLVCSHFSLILSSRIHALKVKMVLLYQL